jgi:hypothetical protein
MFDNWYRNASQTQEHKGARAVGVIEAACWNGMGSSVMAYRPTLLHLYTFVCMFVHGWL